MRTADGSLVQRPVASVRPMQHGARWIPADVWRRQGMTAQEMTLPLGEFRIVEEEFGNLVQEPLLQC